MALFVPEASEEDTPLPNSPRTPPSLAKPQGTQIQLIVSAWLGIGFPDSIFH